MNIDFTTIIDYIGTFASAISGIRLAISQAIRLVRGHTWLEPQQPSGAERHEI